MPNLVLENILVKTLKSRERTAFTVSYSKVSHRNCKTHRLVLNPKKSMNEISYKNNVRNVRV